MLRGIYESTSALLGLQQQESLWADNLANQGTPGYLEEASSFGTFMTGALKPVGGTSPGLLSLGAGISGDAVSSAPGSTETTGRPLDLAFLPNVFLTVRTPGGAAYTRDGALTVDAAGVLTTAAGLPVTGRGGALIHVSGEAAVSITGGGTVLDNGKAVGQLALVTIPQGKVLPGASPATYVPVKGTAVAAGGAVIPGALTMSNVNAATGLTSIIQVEGSYQANEQAAHTIAQSFNTFLTTGVQP